ncbi:MAG: xanthine dehydrogenase family protein subunit M [Rhizobacter sp.]|nr:xanthine dehydrogenase family protein subunit M [Rhizobacter sp.]
MKAQAFRYVKASTLNQVFDLLDEHGEDAKVLAGGQSLIPALNMRLASPSILIDINGVPELTGISVSDDTLRIGALTRHHAVELSSDIERCVPLVSQAIRFVAHAAIRNRGTFGGSIVFADPAAELPACSVALDANFVLASRAGERRVSARSFFRGMYEIDLNPGELLIYGEFPIQRAHYRSAFLELSRRRGDYAIAGIAVNGSYKENRFADMSIAYFGVGPTPMLAKTVVSTLEGKSFTKETLEAAKAAVSNDISPDNDLYQRSATKIHLAQILTARALSTFPADSR